MKRILLVVGHQKSAQGAVNQETGISEWEFNSVLVSVICKLLGERAWMLSADVPHWKKAPIINDLHAKTPFEAVIEFHLNSCDKDARVNYCLAKFARGSAGGQDLSVELMAALRQFGIKPAAWTECVLPGAFPTDKTPPKDQQHGEWWDKNGWKYRGATFLWKTTPPAVLLETFFISCTSFLETVQGPEKIGKLAGAIADAIQKYLDSR